MSRPFSPTRWHELESLLDELLDATPERRAQLFAELSRSDEAKREELERLLAECEREQRLLDRPVVERFAALLDVDTRFPEMLGERYRLTRQLGQGGMASVYLARDLKHGRDVAVKVVRPDLSASLGHARFLREIEIAARLHHPHIVPLYDSGEANGTLYYVMPYEAGHSLRERLTRDGPLPIDDAVAILRDLCDALAHAHRHGVVHRDIKPDNVLLAGKHAMVTDFGVARAVSAASGDERLTATGASIGTPAYMAPEQVTGEAQVDHRADIYSVGVLAYELLAGRPPFTGPTLQSVFSAHITQPPEPITTHRHSVPLALAELVMRCLEKLPADRWQDADEMLRRLESLAAAGSGVTAGASSPGTPASVSPAQASISNESTARRWRTPRVAMTIGAAAALAIAAILGWKLTRDDSGIDPKRVAVVRFRNLTGADSLELFGAVLADMLTNGLTRTEAVSVVPASSATSASGGARDGPFDLRAVAAKEGAGLVVSGSYFMRGDSLGIQTQVIDVRRGSPLAPIALVTVALPDRERGVGDVLQRVMVALSARVNPELAQAAPHTALPMSMGAYREYLTGLELYRSGRARARALQHFYRAISLDSTSGSAFLFAALIEWAESGDLPKVDSLLRIVERHKNDLLPLDQAHHDWLRAWLDGDLEGALHASRRGADLAPRVLAAGAVQASIRVNRLDEAYARVQRNLRIPWHRSNHNAWQFLTHILHVRGDYSRELRETRRGVAAMGQAGPPHAELRESEIRALAALGRTSELRARIEEERSLDSASKTFYDAARELRWHGHEAAGREVGRLVAGWYREAATRSPRRVVRLRLAATLYELGEWDEARRLFESLAAEPLPERFGFDHWQAYDVIPLGYLGIDAARRGDTAAAEAVIQRLGAITRPYVLGANAHWQARITARLGQCERAVAFLHDGLRRGSSAYYTNSFGFALEIPEFASLARCPAFQEFKKPKR